MKWTSRCARPTDDAALFHPVQWPERVLGIIAISALEEAGVFELSVRWPTGVMRSMLISCTQTEHEFNVSILRADWVSGSVSLVNVGSDECTVTLDFFFVQSAPHAFLLECTVWFKRALKDLGVHSFS